MVLGWIQYWEHPCLFRRAVLAFEGPCLGTISPYTLLSFPEPIASGLPTTSAQLPWPAVLWARKVPRGSPCWASPGLPVLSFAVGALLGTPPAHWKVWLLPHHMDPQCSLQPPDGADELGAWAMVLLTPLPMLCNTGNTRTTEPVAFGTSSWYPHHRLPIQSSSQYQPAPPSFLENFVLGSKLLDFLCKLTRLDFQAILWGWESISSPWGKGSRQLTQPWCHSASCQSEYPSQWSWSAQSPLLLPGEKAWLRLSWLGP